MEGEVPEIESASSGSTLKSKLRYPLRSTIMSKEEKTSPLEVSKSSSSKKGKAASIVSKSISVLDLHGKGKITKSPRRISVPSKTTVRAVSKTNGNITPKSDTKTNGSANSQLRSDTPASVVSKSGNRKRFSIMTSSSYWLSQIKLSESASKHSVSLGFFKLASDAGCEPIQRMRDELKSYARRNKLGDHEALAKQVLEIYNISENLEQLQFSETVSRVTEEGTRSSDDNVHSSSTMGTGKLRPESRNVNPLLSSTCAEPAKKENTRKNDKSSALIKNSSARSAKETGGRNLRKKLQKENKQESEKGQNEIEKQGKKDASGIAESSPSQETVPEKKENTDAAPSNDISSAEVI